MKVGFPKAILYSLFSALILSPALTTPYTSGPVPQDDHTSSTVHTVHTHEPFPAWGFLKEIQGSKRQEGKTGKMFGRSLAAFQNL
jgi:hypothetical protein